MFDGGEIPWGDAPPFRAPVFVVTRRDREILERQGGTSFTFVTGGIERAVALAKEAAGGKDVAVAGGGTLLRQVLAAGLLDEFELHVAPVLLGDGMRLFEAGLGLDVREGIELTPARVVETPEVIHIRYSIGPRSRLELDARAAGVDGNGSAEMQPAGYNEDADLVLRSSLMTARVGDVDFSYAEGPDNGPPLALLHA
jgi:dihydrofolate reductase